MYEIKVLSDKEFFEVAKSDKRYSYVDETNLGFADALKGKAYVRHTSHPELQKYLINHELEELIEAHEGHEDANGIRHKKLGNIFRAIFNPINIPIPGLHNKDKGVFNVGQSSSAKQAEAESQAQQQAQQEQQQMAQMFGSYSPQGATSGVSGASGSPLNLFGSGSYAPGNVPDAASGSYTPGFLGQSAEQLPDYLKQQKFGAEDGRIVF